MYLGSQYMPKYNTPNWLVAGFLQHCSVILKPSMHIKTCSYRIAGNESKFHQMTLGLRSSGTSLLFFLISQLFKVTMMVCALIPRDWEADEEESHEHEAIQGYIASFKFKWMYITWLVSKWCTHMYVLMQRLAVRISTLSILFFAVLH